MAEQDMSQRVIFITGGNSGIGLETALLFADQGANIVIFSRRERLNTIAKNQILAKDVKCLAFSGDVTKEREVELALEKTMEIFGRLDFAFNNAGIEQTPKPLFQQTEEEYDEIMDVNLKGVWACMKHEIPLMMQSGGGVIVNNSSVTGIVGSDRVAAFVAAKHAVVGITRAAALEYAHLNIRVNAICPAGVETPMLERIIGDDPLTRDAVDDYHALQRCATAKEIADSVLWLCSNRASFVTGHALVIDGGASIR